MDSFPRHAGALSVLAAGAALKLVPGSRRVGTDTVRSGSARAAGACTPGSAYFSGSTDFVGRSAGCAIVGGAARTGNPACPSWTTWPGPLFCTSADGFSCALGEPGYALLFSGTSIEMAGSSSVCDGLPGSDA